MILIDTGPLVALFDPRDGAREAVEAHLRLVREPILVPQPVIGELAHFLGRALIPAREARALRQLARGQFSLEPAEAQDFGRAAQLVEQYADFPLGTVDALVVAMAERLGITTLFTLDRKHFGAVRPAHCESFEIVP